MGKDGIAWDFMGVNGILIYPHGGCWNLRQRCVEASVRQSLARNETLSAAIETGLPPDFRGIKPKALAGEPASRMRFGCLAAQLNQALAIWKPCGG